MSFLGILGNIYKIVVYQDTIGKSPGSNAQHLTLPFEFRKGEKKHFPSKKSLL